MKKKTFFKIIVYTLTLIHLTFLIGIIWSLNNKTKIKEKPEVLNNVYKYDFMPLTVNIDNSDLNLNVVEIETGKLLVINDEISFDIEDVNEVFYSRYKDFLLIIEKYESNYRFIFIDKSLNILKDLREYKENEVYEIKDYKLFEDKIEIEMKSEDNKKIKYLITWQDSKLIEKIEI